MSDWLRSLGDRGGPLIAAAQSFLETHRGAPAKITPDGDGARALADAIDAWAERDDAGDREDEAFVEGAGALFAALILASIGGRHCARGGAHRIALGDGFFDPFAAIDAALDDENGARRSLAASIARARAEANGSGGIGRAHRIFREILSRQRPELAIESSFDGSLALSGGIEIDLRRVIAATDGASDDSTERAIEKLIAMLPGGTVDHSDSQENLLPRLVAPDFGGDLGVPLAIRPILGGALGLALVIAYQDRARYVRQDEPAKWGIDHQQAIERAVQNLAARSERARLLRVDTDDGPLLLMRTGDGLDAARLLLPALHEVLADQLGTPLLVAVPHRDALWAAAKPARAELARRAKDDAARAPHRISDALFSLSVAGLEALS
jgi:hypothetical protein